MLRFAINNGDYFLLVNQGANKVFSSSLKAFHVPGHSPGSFVYYCEEAACVFSGDALFYGSIGRADLKGGNFDELKEGICNHLFTLPEETRVYPGHGPSTSIGYEKKNNPFFR